jgi:RecB family endonuclease NucS
MIRNTTLNKNLVNVCKSIITGGADRQPGLTSRDLYVQLQRRSAAVRKDGQTAEQAFAKYAAEDPDGKLLFAAMRKAKQVPWDQSEEDEEQQNADGNAAYRKLMSVANEKRRPNESVQAAFARIYASSEYKKLVDQDKECSRNVNRVGG